MELEDWSNFNMSARFKAGAMGLPFIPCRSPMGSDVLRANRSKIIDCPFTGSPVAVVPACHPNVALIHVQEADIYGNCRIEGPLFTCPEIAMASAHTIVTCERLVEHDEMTREPNRINIPSSPLTQLWSFPLVLTLATAMDIIILMKCIFESSALPRNPSAREKERPW
ncbi:hypothetical protein N752_19135 [Desulforamulus aquiferis]|nr:hypothetical protein N752_19135 [Desulforamulus aquiferis]